MRSQTAGEGRPPPSLRRPADLVTRSNTPSPRWHARGHMAMCRPLRRPLPRPVAETAAGEVEWPLSGAVPQRADVVAKVGVEVAADDDDRGDGRAVKVQRGGGTLDFGAAG